MAEQRFEFASRAWLEALGGVMHAAFARAGGAPPGERLSFSHEYSDPPAHLADGVGRIGWSIRIADGALRYAPGPVDDADVAVVADYASLLPLSRLVYGEDAEARARGAASVGELVAAGKVVVCRGDLACAPRFFEDVHDEIARRTA